MVSSGIEDCEPSQTTAVTAESVLQQRRNHTRILQAGSFSFADTREAKALSSLTKALAAHHRHRLERRQVAPACFFELTVEAREGGNLLVRSFFEKSLGGRSKVVYYALALQQVDHRRSLTCLALTQSDSRLTPPFFSLHDVRTAIAQPCYASSPTLSKFKEKHYEYSNRYRQMVQRF